MEDQILSKVNLGLKIHTTDFSIIGLFNLQFTETRLLLLFSNLNIAEVFMLTMKLYFFSENRYINRQTYILCFCRK